MPAKKAKDPINELNKLQAAPGYIRGVPTIFNDIQPDALLWAMAVNKKDLNYKTELIRVTGVQPLLNNSLKISFEWMLFTTSPWNEPRYIIIEESNKDLPIYERKYIATDPNISVPQNKKLTLHTILKVDHTADPYLKGIKFVHTNNVHYGSYYEQRTALLELHKTVKTAVPYHLLGTIKLNSEPGAKASLDSRGIIANIMPRLQVFPLNIVPCNSPTFEHWDHWYRYTQYHELNKPIENSDEYIRKFHAITDDQVYSEHFCTKTRERAPSITNLYIDGDGAKSATETLGVVSLNCFAKNIITIMKSYEKVFSVSTVILLQEAGGLTTGQSNNYDNIKSTDTWIDIDPDGYLPILSEPHGTRTSVFDTSNNQKKAAFEKDNNIRRKKQLIGPRRMNEPINEIECFEFSQAAISAHKYLENYQIVFTTEKLNVNEVNTNYVKNKPKKLAILVKKNYWKKMSVSILTYRVNPLNNMASTAILAIEDSIVPCLILEDPSKPGWKPIIVCSAHMIAEQEPNREAMNRQFYHVVLPQLKHRANTVLTAGGFVVVGNDANINNVDLTAAVTCEYSKDPKQFDVTENALHFYKDTVIGLANNNVTTHSHSGKRRKFGTSSYDNIVFVNRLNAELRQNQFVYTIKVPVYVGFRLLDSALNPHNYPDHSPVACRIGDAIVTVDKRKYYKLPDHTFNILKPPAILSKFKKLKMDLEEEQQNMKVQSLKFKFTTMVGRAQVGTLHKLIANLWNSIYSIKSSVDQFSTQNRSSNTLKRNVSHKIKAITVKAKKLLNIQGDVDFSCHYVANCNAENDDDYGDDYDSNVDTDHRAISPLKIGSPDINTTKRKIFNSPSEDLPMKESSSPAAGTDGMTSAPAAGKRSVTPQLRRKPSVTPQLHGTRSVTPQLHGKRSVTPQLHEIAEIDEIDTMDQSSPPAVARSSTKDLKGGSINKIQIIKEQIKIIKDKYKNTKLDKYLIQIANLKHKIILQTFTDKLLKIKEKIKDYKTEINANPNKKNKYIKHIDKLIEKFNVLKQEQDTLKQKI